MTSTPLTDQQLLKADLDHGVYRTSHSHPGAFACCTAHAAADHVPALLAEVRRLRDELAAEKAAHRFTLRQRNNRSNRLIKLRDLALAGDTDTLAAAAKDTLAASVDDHTACAAPAVVETGE